MAISSVKYYITDANGNFIDWNQSVAGLSILGKEAEVSGSAGGDGVFVQAGASANLSDLGGGNDKVYLTGNFNQYVQTIDQATGVYTFVRTAGLLLGQTEVVKVTAGTDDDVLYFADGHMTFNAATDTRLYDGSTFFSVQAGWLAAGGTPAGGPVERNTPTSAGSPTRIFVTDAGGVDLPGLSQPGQKMTVVGSVGSDSVYLKPGTTIDASDLGGGNDRIYLTGNLAEYSQTIDQATGVYTLSRTTASGTEVVKVTAGTDDDLLYFADGHVVFNASTDSRLYDGTTFFNLQASLLVSGGSPGTTATVTTINISTAPNLSGQSVISGKALANATVNIAIDPDNNAATSNSFTYTTTADANGDYSLNLATATPASGTASFVAGTASVSVTQAVPGGASPATVITLPVSTTTSYSASIASDHITEGGNAVFTVTRSGDTSGTGTVVYATQNGTATAGSDYTAAGATLSFAAGQTTKTVTVATTDDAAVEGNETLSLVLTNPVGGVLGTSSASATIVDNEGPVFSLSNTSTGVSFSEGVGTYSFTVNREGLTTNAATVVVSSAGGTATAGADYTVVNQTVSFAAGETSKTVTVTIADDAVVEGNETFNVQLSSPSAGGLIDASKASITATIQDNEVAVIGFGDAGSSVTVNEDAGSVTLSLVRTGPATSAASVIVTTTSSGSASFANSADFSAGSQTITFAAGQTQRSVTINITDDAIAEVNENFVVSLSGVSGAIVDSGASSRTVTINDNDQSVWAITNAGDVVEGAGTATFTVSRTGASPAATVVFATGGGTALPGSDYTAATQTLSFGAGVLSLSVTVPVTDDTQVEGDETLTAFISNASTGTIVTPISTLTLHDNEQSTWSVSTTTATASEGAGALVYRVSRTGPLDAASIMFSTGSGTATAGDDYIPVNAQTLTFAAGVSYMDVHVSLLDDTQVEAEETVFGVIDSASTGTIMQGTAMATVLDNEQSAWRVSTDGFAPENAGPIFFVVSRTGATDAATIVFRTTSGSASSGLDYINSGDVTLNFAEGVTQMRVPVAIINDSLVEAVERVNGSITNASTGTIVVGTALSGILDDDAASVWWMSGSSASSEASGSLVFTVSRYGSLDAGATVVVGTTGGSAAAGVDYVALPETTLTFAAGESSRDLAITLLDDNLREGSETIGVVLHSPSMGIPYSDTSIIAQTLTILDDDESVWSVAASSSIVSEGAGSVSFVVSRTGATEAATIAFDVLGGTSTVGVDYTAAPQTLSFAAGEISKVVSINIVADTVPESNETLVVGLSGASTGTYAASTNTVTIADDDQSIWGVGVAVNGINFAVETSDYMSFLIARTGSSAAATIEFATAGGTAAGGFDYVPVRQLLSFAAGEMSKTVQVGIINDSLAESSSTETVIGVIGNASQGTIVTPTASASLVDDDQTYWTVAGISQSSSGLSEDSGYMAFNVVRAGDISATQTIDFRVVNGSTGGGPGIPGVDYATFSKTLTFVPGAVNQIVMVPIIADAVPEVAETLAGFISNASGGIITTATFAATMAASDQTRTAFAIGAVLNSVSEDAAHANFQVSRSGDLSVAQTIEVYVAGGTAVAGTDYSAFSPVTVSFAAGDNAPQILSLGLLGDAVADGSKTLVMGLRNASGGTISTPTSTVTLFDGDAATAATSYTTAVTSNNVHEDTGTVAYTITRTGDLSAATTTYFRTGTGSATAGSDYTAIASQTLSWAIGESVKVVFVQLLSDAVAESSETIIGQHSTDNFSSVQSSTTATILDDDTATGVNTYSIVAGGNAYEAGGIAGFVVTRGGDLTIASTSYFRNNGGSCTEGADYTSVGGETLSWGVGEVTKVVASVALINDGLAEASETVIGQIATDSGFTLNTATATITILDDDAQVMAAGVADTLTTGTVSGNYLGGTILNTGDLDDVVTIGTASTNNSVIDLGAGNDTLNTGTTQANFFVNGAQYIGGAGVDTLALNTTTAFNFSTTVSPGNFVKGFEIVSMAASGNQTLNLSLADVLEFTSGNTVADTLRITGTAGDILNLQALGKTLSTPAPGTGNLTDVDGTTYDVVASAAGNAAANDVSIGGVTYDVYQYQHSGHTINLLVNTLLTTNVV